MTDRSIEVGVNFTSRGAAQVRGQVETVSSEVGKLNSKVEQTSNAQQAVNRQFGVLARQRALDTIADDAARLYTELDSAGDQARYLAEQLGRVGATEGEIAGVVNKVEQLNKARSSAPGSGSNGLGVLDNVGSASSAVLSGLGAGDAANAAGLLGDIAGAAGMLSPPVLAFTAASAGLAIVLNNAVESTKRATEATLSRVNAEDDLARQMARLTQEGAQKRLEELQAELNIELGILATREAEYKDFKAAVDANPFDDLRQAMGLAFGEEAGLKKAYEDQATTVEDLIREQLTLNTGLRDQTFAADSTAEATQKAADALLLLQQAVSAQVAQNMISSQLDALRLSREQRQQAAADATREAQVITDYLNSADRAFSLTAEQIDQLELRASLLTDRAQILTDALDNQADATLRAKDQATTYAKALDATVKAAADASKAAKDRNQAVLDATTKQVDAETALTKARNELTTAQTVAAARITAIEQDTIEKRKQIARDWQELTADTAKRINDLRRQTDRDLSRALREGSRSQALSILETAQDNVNSIKDGAAKQEQVLKDREADLLVSSEKQLQIEREKGAVEIALKQQAYAQAQVDLTNALATLKAIQDQGQGAQTAAAAAYQVQLGLLAQAGATQIIQTAGAMWQSIVSGAQAAFAAINAASRSSGALGSSNGSSSFDIFKAANDVGKAVGSVLHWRENFTKLLSGWLTAGSFAGGFASGGSLAPGQFGIAGERGAELVRGGAHGATVFSANQSRDMMRGSTTIFQMGDINIPVSAGLSDIDGIVETVTNQVGIELRERLIAAKKRA